MKRTVAVQGVLLVLIALGISTGAVAQVPDANDSDDADIQVNIAEKTAIDITPEVLSYTGIDPGTRATQTSTEGYSSVEIENIGSMNITEVWMNATTPDQNPFGTGLSSTYDAGNFIEISPESGTAGVNGASKHTFVNRKEYNESGDLSYILTPTTENSDGNWRYGRFRVNDQEVFWAMNASATGDSCDTDTDGDDFRVGTEAHNQTNTGANDFTDTNDYTPYNLDNTNTDKAVATDVWVNTSEFERQYDIVANCGSSDTWAMRTKYNVEAAGVDLTQVGSVANYLLNGAENSQDSLQPGEYFGLDTAINVPQGVAQGDVGPGLLRVFANSN